MSCRGIAEHVRQARLEDENNANQYTKKTNDDNEIKNDKYTKNKKHIKKSEVYSEFEKKWNIILNRNEDILLLKEIDTWIGTPYKFGGITKSGVDCSGLVLSIYKNVYDIDVNRNSYELWKNSRTVKRKNLICGDLIFFKINRKDISHVGIYIANNYFVHASSSRGVVIDDLSQKYFSDRFANGGRIK